MFWIGLVVGLFIGANIGFILVALCVAASKGEHHENLNRPR